MTDQAGIPDATTLEGAKRSIAILGAGGDLTERLLLPGLGRVAELARDSEFTLIGAARTPQSDDEWKALVRRSLEDAEIPAHTVESLVSRARFLATDASDPEQLKALIDACPSAPVLYVALPPAMGHAIAESLARIELPDDLVVAIEKPFGEDLEDAVALNEALAGVVPDGRLWRVDHFLGNATVMGMLGLRFGNRLLETSWSAEHIEKIEIVYDETLGIEGRAAFYDSTGALRDMLQSHLLMVLALTTMERPDEIVARDVHERMAEVLGAVRLWRDDPSTARRARYTEGRVDGRFFPSYVDEPDVDASAGTETLAQVLLQIDTPRWDGVPFVLRSGKGIGDPRTEVAVHFRPSSPPRGLRTTTDESGTVLRMSLKGGDVELDLFVNSADDPTDLERVTLEASPGEATLDAYAQVLAGILQGDTLLSVPGDVAEQCWRIVTPVLSEWARGDAPLEEYPAGSRGPEGW
ncbi:glucose-6-phosphate dehydrogenase [Rathayibacter sp. VKM Ac-2759]|uniref:glucose-6-phosphate dehydrogenase n=1 Tax=Rathayibacter sp. VKM Ac-2759 TaxID=2609252 RepID=UPI001316A7A1|nr:glucose-6-phosphate dehydrogenase [Rathayibacter sp. VKM Ac-2759]QHC66704.1 glucose-6-phosphate dehydrogenase [Rathayibacter sp. VKM Ac-2759]